jgi:NAD(P)-dependent dehydrogenase (short-subunit alcohol dehydrogenase family)
MSEETYSEFLMRGQQTHALGRVGSTEEVAKGIFYLAKDATFTTGHLLQIDGGRSLMTPR